VFCTNLITRSSRETNSVEKLYKGFYEMLVKTVINLIEFNV